MKRKIQQKIAQAAVVITCSGCLTMSALANSATGPSSYTEGPSSNVWLTVVEFQSEARISVNVPLSYGFAVVGSLEDAASGGVSSENGKILLSNVRVEVTDPSTNGTDGEYTITTVGGSQVPVENRSTDVRAEALGTPNPPREGIPVKLKPYVVEVPETVIDKVAKEHYWRPVGEDPTGNRDMLKRYRMGLNGKWFSQDGVVTDGKKSYSVYYLEEDLLLEAPPDVTANGWNAGGSANIPSITYFDVDVQVGGVQNQYRQVEQSVKVGQIGWVIVPGELPETPAP